MARGGESGLASSSGAPLRLAGAKDARCSDLEALLSNLSRGIDSVPDMAAGLWADACVCSDANMILYGRYQRLKTKFNKQGDRVAGLLARVEALKMQQSGLREELQAERDRSAALQRKHAALKAQVFGP